MFVYMCNLNTTAENPLGFYQPPLSGGFLFDGANLGGAQALSARACAEECLEASSCVGFAFDTLVPKRCQFLKELANSTWFDESAGGTTHYYERIPGPKLGLSQEIYGRTLAPKLSFAESLGQVQPLSSTSGVFKGRLLLVHLTPDLFVILPLYHHLSNNFCLANLRLCYSSDRRCPLGFFYCSRYPNLVQRSCSRRCSFHRNGQPNER